MDRQRCKCTPLNDGGIEQYLTDLTQEGSIFQRIVAPTAKALVSILVLILGTKGQSVLDDRS